MKCTPCIRELAILSLPPTLKAARTDLRASSFFTRIDPSSCISFPSDMMSAAFCSCSATPLFYSRREAALHKLRIVRKLRHEGIQRLRSPTEGTDCSAFKNENPSLSTNTGMISPSSIDWARGGMMMCSAVNFVRFHRNSQSFLKMSGLYSFLPASEGNSTPKSSLLRLARRRQSIVTFSSPWRGSSHILMVLS